MSDKRPLWVKCGDCSHVWVAVWLPMEMNKAARLMSRVSCPNCAAPTKRVFVASAADIPSAAQEGVDA